jgi:hypothetical protein
MESKTLALAGVQYRDLRQHLFPGDGLEAAAILLCSRTTGRRVKLLTRHVLLVPHSECRRQRDSLVWPGDWIETALDLAEPEGLSLVFIHSHPGGMSEFSAVDDRSDREVLPGVFQNHGDIHGSAIMTPDGRLFGRVYDAQLRWSTVELCTVAGDDLLYWWSDGSNKRPVAFTSAMTGDLQRLSCAVLGVSGTGSIIAEQACRLGFGRVTLIDFDRVEAKNLNRILNATLDDVARKRLKVDSFRSAAVSYRGPGVVDVVPKSLLTREAVLAAAQCDVMFCCVDSLAARQIADLISTAYLIPLFDVGVVIPVRQSNGEPAVADVCGRIDYIQPGKSTLRDRGVYSAESLRGEYLRQVSPDAHRLELDAGYLKGLVDEAPAVITLNMRAASACMNEFIARAFPFRLDNNEGYARTSFSLAACEEEFRSESSFAAVDRGSLLGRGSLEPLLGLPFLAPERQAA